MPSPIGHALGGLLAGWLIADVRPRPSAPAAGVHPSAVGVGAAAVSERTGGPRETRRRVAVFAVLGTLPDIDFLFGTHSTYTHSVGAILLVFGIAAALARAPRLRTAAACASAYGTHVLLDWLGSDGTPPIGIMALWPVTDAFFQSRLHVFAAISRRYWIPGFWTHNMRALVRELLLLGPPALALAWWRRRRLVMPTRGR